MDGELDPATLARLEVQPGVADEQDGRPGHLGHRVVQVHLDDLGASPLAHVGDGEADGDGAVGGDLGGRRPFDVVPAEGGVRPAVAEWVERVRIDGADRGPVGQSRADVGGRLRPRVPRHADRQAPGRVDRSGQDPGQRRAALLAGKERLHHGRGGERAERVGPPGQQDDHHRRARGEHGLEQPALDARQVQVGGVAALARGAPAEQPGPVAHHGDADVAAGGQGRGRPDAGRVGIVDSAAWQEFDLAVRQLVTQRRQEGRDLHADLEIGVSHAHVARERVAPQHGERVVGPRADDRDPVPAGQRQPGQWQDAVVG